MHILYGNVYYKAFYKSSSPGSTTYSTSIGDLHIPSYRMPYLQIFDTAIDAAVAQYLGIYRKPAARFLFTANLRSPFTHDYVERYIRHHHPELLV